MRNRFVVVIIYLAGATWIAAPANGQTAASLGTNPTAEEAKTTGRSILAAYSSAQLCKELARRGQRCVKEGNTLAKPTLSVVVASTNLASAAPLPDVGVAPPPPLPRRAAAPSAGGTVGQPFFIVRQDQYDEVFFDNPLLWGKIIQGASASYTNNQISGSQTASINAFVGYSAYSWESSDAEKLCGQNAPAFISNYGFGPFLLADGNYMQPTSSTEKSALRLGMNGNASFCNLASQSDDFKVMPYGQTDFRGRASIGGADVLWEPFNLNPGVNLGGQSDVLTPKTIGYYFRFIGEANIFDVDNAGLTNFTAHTAYALLGGTGQARAVLFENEPWMGKALCGRISLIGTAQYLWDAAWTRQSIYQYGAEVDYNLGSQTPYCSDPSAPTPDPSAGTATIAFSYSQGTDPATYVRGNTYKLSLKFGF